MLINASIRSCFCGIVKRKVMLMPRNCMHNLHTPKGIPKTCSKHPVTKLSRGFSKSTSFSRTSVTLLTVQKNSRFGRLGVCAVLPARFQSTQTDTAASGATAHLASDLPPGYIPEPPIVPAEELSEKVLNSLGEVPLADLGLCNYTPSGFIQWGLENLHVGLDLPWWGAIAIGTVIVRLCLFPLVIKSQKTSVALQNHMPTIQKLQANMTKARQEGNHLKAMQITMQLQEYMKGNNVKPFTAFSVPLFQVPIFISVFVGLRAMANLPVESMTTGGLFWFTDLTIADPLHILPFITAATLLATFEIGADGLSTQQMTHVMKWGMRGMSVLVIPFMWKFPAAMLCYWLTANFFSLVQVSFLKINRVRTAMGIPVRVNHAASGLVKKKNFVEGFKDSMDNTKMMNRIEQRRQANVVAFEKAGQAPLKKTYKYNPKTANKVNAEAKKV